MRIAVEVENDQLELAAIVRVPNFHAKVRSVKFVIDTGTTSRRLV